MYGLYYKYNTFILNYGQEVLRGTTFRSLTDRIWKSYVPHLEVLRTTFRSLTDHI